MLTREQTTLLRSIEARHHSRPACIMVRPRTDEWTVASRLLHLDSQSENGDRFTGTPDELREFFEQVNEMHRNPSVKSTSLGHILGCE